MGDVVRLSEVPGLHTREVRGVARAAHWWVGSVEVQLALVIARHLDHRGVDWADGDLVELREVYAELLAELRAGVRIGSPPRGW